MDQTRSERLRRRLTMLLRLQQIKARMAALNSNNGTTTTTNQPSSAAEEPTYEMRFSDRLPRSFSGWRSGSISRRSRRRHYHRDASHQRSQRSGASSSASAGQAPPRLVVIILYPSRRRSPNMDLNDYRDRPRCSCLHRRQPKVLQNPSSADANRARLLLRAMLGDLLDSLQRELPGNPENGGNGDAAGSTNDATMDTQDDKEDEVIANPPSMMAIENVVTHQPDRSNQQSSDSGLTMWEALVQVASERYEELLEAERQQKLLKETAVEQAQVSQPATLIRSAELSIAVNVTVGEELEDEEPNRLVIDESAPEMARPAEPIKPMELQAFTPNRVGQPQIRQGVIVSTDQPCCSSSSSNSSSNGSGNHMLRSPLALSDTGESSHLLASAGGIRPIRQHPTRRMSQVSFDRFMPYPIPSSYNKNMARKFPGAENRTPEQQAVRERNTVAARQSRAKMRMMDEMLHQEANNERTHNRYMKERMAGLFMYANILREKIGLDGADFIEEFDRVKQDYVPGPIRSHHVRARSRGEGQIEHQVPQQQDREGSQVEIQEIEGTASGRADVNLNDTNRKSNVSFTNSDTDSVPELENTVLDLSLKSKHV